jgi:hypothetical protein
MSLLTTSWVTLHALNLLKLKPGGESYDTFNSWKNKGNYHKNTQQSDGLLTPPVALWRPRAKRSKSSEASTAAPPPHLCPVLQVHSVSQRVSGLTLMQAKQSKPSNASQEYLLLGVLCMNTHTKGRVVSKK